MADIKVKGLRELDEFLTTLTPKLEQNVLRGGMRAGANVVKTEVRRLAPVKSGQLRDGVKVSTNARRGRVSAKVKLTGKHAFLGPWLEFGTAAHQIKAKGKGLFFGGLFARSVDHPGARPQPFMRPALDGKAQEALIAVGNHIKRRLATKHGLNTSDIDVEAE